MQLSATDPTSLFAYTTRRGALINVPLIVYIIYALFYTVLDPVAGSTWAVFIGLPIWLTSTLFATAFAENGAYIALGVQVISWYMQVGAWGCAYECRLRACKHDLGTAAWQCPASTQHGSP